MSRTVTNIHGRKAGRGLRPWLLLPKVLAIGVYFGALVTVAVIWFTGPRRTGHLDDPQVAAWISQVSNLFRFVVVPALLLVMSMGVTLFMQHPAAFASMRWWRAKIASLVVGLPLGHLFMASRFHLLRQASGDDWSAEFQIECGLILLVIWSIWLIFLGRHKPRLGQDWAKSFPHGTDDTLPPKDPNAPTNPGRGLMLLAVAAGLGLCSCNGDPDVALDDANRPANLSVQFHVLGQRAPGDPLRQTSMYVLEPDRHLRVAIGYQAQAGFYPRVVRTISPGEYQAIVKLVHDRRLMSEPTSPIAEAADKQTRPPPVIYRVDLSAWGLVNRYSTTAEESPPTAELLARLIAASGSAKPPASP